MPLDKLAPTAVVVLDRVVRREPGPVPAVEADASPRRLITPVTVRRTMLRKAHRQTILGEHDLVYGHAEPGKLLKLPHNCRNVDLITRAEFGATHPKDVVRLHDPGAHRFVLTDQIVHDVTTHERHERM